MQKTMIAMGLVLGTLLTGCGNSPVFTAEAPEREKTIGQSTNGQKRQVLPMDKVRKGTYLGKDDPARHGLTKFKPGTSPVGGASAEGMPEALAQAEVAPIEGPGYLALLKAPDDMKVAPVIGEGGAIEKLLFSPSAGTVSWSVRAEGAGVVVKTVKLTLVTKALYPAEGEVAATPAMGIEGEAAEPVTVELDTAALGWPAAIRTGSEARLALNLKTDAIRDFLKANESVYKLLVKVELLDAKGFPVLDHQEKPMTLLTTVQVL